MAGSSSSITFSSVLDKEKFIVEMEKAFIKVRWELRDKEDWLVEPHEEKTRRISELRKKEGFRKQRQEWYMTRILSKSTSRISDPQMQSTVCDLSCQDYYPTNWKGSCR